MSQPIAEEPTDDSALRVTTFSQSADVARTRACQHLRYRVYHHHLGLDTPDMDHQAQLDVEDNDPLSDCVTVTAGEELVGCLRMQPSGRGPFYAQKEFVFVGDMWQSPRFVEGARFAIPPEHRKRGVAMRLFGAFRDYCRERELDRLISVSIVSDPEARPEVALAVLSWLHQRVKFELHHARPMPGYEFELPLEDASSHPPIEPSLLPPMMHMLANSRTMLCSPPAYCPRFHTWNFLLLSRLRVKGPSS